MKDIIIDCETITKLLDDENYYSTAKGLLYDKHIDNNDCIGLYSILKENKENLKQIETLLKEWLNINTNNLSKIMEFTTNNSKYLETLQLILNKVDKHKIYSIDLINIYNFLDKNKKHLNQINTMLNFEFQKNTIDKNILKEILNNNFYESLKEAIYEHSLKSLNENTEYTKVLKIAYFTYIQQIKLNKHLNVSNELKDTDLVSELLVKLGDKLGDNWKKYYCIRYKDDMYNLINNYLNDDVVKKTKFKKLNTFNPYDFNIINRNCLKGFLTHLYSCSQFLEKISYNYHYSNKPESDAKEILKKEYHKDLYKSIYYYNFSEVTTNLTFQGYFNIAYKTYSEQLKLNLILCLSNEIYDLFLVGCVIQEMVRALYSSTDIKKYEGELYEKLKENVRNDFSAILDEMIRESKNNKSLKKR